MNRDIVRLNIKRSKQMLKTETDESSRQTIEIMLREFERMLTSSECEKAPQVSSQQS
jgi:hypothetical protein